MSGKSQTIGIAVSRLSRILLRYRGNRQTSLVTDAIFICLGNVGNWSEAVYSIGNEFKLPPLSRQFKFEFSHVANDRRPSQKSGKRRENRNTPDFPDLSATIRDDRGYLRFPVFISRESLGRSGNSEIPHRLGFSRDMKLSLIKTH